MTTPLEQELTRTLTAAVGAGPRPDEEFVGRVHRRQRQRRRRTVLVAACTAVLVMIGGGAAVGTLMSGSGDAEFAERLPNFRRLKPIEEVWPEAIRRIPGTLPDGGSYLVAAILDGNRYLVSRTDERGVVRDWDGPLVFDAARGTVQQLGDTKLYGTMTPGMVSGHLPRAVGDQAAWLLTGMRDGSMVWEWWAAPLDGSAPARRLVSVQDSGLSMGEYGTTDDAIYYTGSQDNDWAIHRLSITGGEPEVVPGSRGLKVLGSAFPWVNSKWLPELEDRSGTLFNVVTGERLTWTADPRVRNVNCDPIACYGSSDGNVEVTHRLDGTGYRQLPGTFRVSGDGRFASGSLRPAPATPPRRESERSFLWDRETGKAALGPRGLGVGLSWLDGNGEMIVFDRRAID